MQMTKKILSIVLAVLMVVSMMAVMAVSVNAAGTGSVEYTTLAGATSTTTSMSQLKDGTYKLLEDHTETTRMAYNLFAYDVTIDLNGHKFTSTATDCAITMGRSGSASNHRKLTIIDSVGGGKFVNNSVSASDSSDAIIIVNNAYNEVTIDAAIEGTACGVAMFGDNQTLNVTGGSITVNGADFAIATNGANTKNPTINISGGNITSTGASAIYQPAQGGTLNISGGTITGTTGVYVKSGTTNVTGGTINGTGDQANYSYNGNGANSTGDAIVVDNCGYPGGAPVVNLVAGTFNSENAQPAASYASQGETQVIDFISGGTYTSTSARVDIENLVNNESSYDSTTGVVTVSPSYVAFVDGTYYDDFADAAAAAIASGSTLTLLANMPAYVMPSTDGATLKVQKNGYTAKKPTVEGAFLVGAATVDDTVTYTVSEAAIEYTTLAGAVSYKSNIDYSNVSGSGTYKLLKDITANSRIVPGMFASNVVFDLNGHTLTSTATDEAFLFSRAGSASNHNSYTIKNGTVVAAGDGVDLLASNADLTLEDVDIVANGVYGVVTNGTKTGNNITATDSSITAGTLGIYKPSNGSLTLTDTDVTGETAVYVKSGDVTIDGGTFTGTGDAADYAYNGDGANITGDAVVIDSCGYPGGAPTVSIVDGTFVSDNGKAVASYVKQDDPTQTGSYEKVDGFIEGGEFSSNVSALVEAGKLAVNDGTSTNEDAPFVISTATLQSVADTEITECDLTGLTFVDGTGYVDDITTCNANLLGVQVRQAPPQDKTYDEGDGTRALRYVAAVKKDFLEGLTDYGFEVTVDNTTVYKSCKGTYNNVISSGADDDYEYFTFAIYNITKTAKPINVKFVLKGANNAEAYAFYKNQAAPDNYTIPASYNVIAGLD